MHWGRGLEAEPLSIPFIDDTAGCCELNSLRWMVITNEAGRLRIRIHAGSVGYKNKPMEKITN